MEEPQQVTTKEPQQVQQVTTKNPKKVEVGKRLAVHNHRQREKKKEEQAQKSKQVEPISQYYEIGTVIAVGMIGLYQAKKGEAKNVSVPVSQQPCPQNNKFEMD